MKTAIIYASSTGTTAEVAKRIAREMEIDDKDIYKVSDFSPSKFGEYEMFIVGSPTYGAGKVQDDWYDMLDGIEALNLNGATVAVFGTGNEKMKKTFCSAVGEIYDRFSKTGARMIGAFNTFPYQFDASKAVPVEGAGAVGLLIDNTNHPDATEERIVKWCEELKKAE